MFVEPSMNWWRYAQRKSRKVFARIPLPPRQSRATFPPGEGMAPARKMNLEVLAYGKA